MDTHVLFHTPDLQRIPQESERAVSSERTLLRPGAAAGLTFRVMSSEQEASKLPVGSHLIALTSFYSGSREDRHANLLEWHRPANFAPPRKARRLTVCPWKVLTGRS